MSSPSLSFPSIEVDIQPSEAGIVHFLRCAPSVDGEDETGLLNLRLRMTNNHTGNIRIREIRIKVSGSSTPHERFFVALPAPGDPALAPNASVSWNQAKDHVFAIPESPRLKIEVFADHFPEPAVIRRDLIQHANPTPSGNYRFWGRAGDLEPGEYWRVHGTGHKQTKQQMFAYDVRVGIGKDGGFDHLKPNPNSEPNWGSINENHRIWGKSVYAVASGVVAHCLNTFPDNEFAGDLTEEIEDLIEAAGHGNGNFFTITTENETVLYAHLQEGTLNEELVRVGPGAQVRTGDFLGLVGNSGSSSAPHLHIHANRSNTGSQSWDDHGRPMLFRQAAAVAWSALGSFNDTPWVALAGRGMPTADCAVWPGNPPPKHPDIREEVTIDPLALVLTGSVYVDLTLPDPPPFELVRDRVRTIIRKMSPEEKRRALGRLKSLDVYYKELQRELER
ncbi:MAG TPA: M23 family metallopeptidase [Pyrinomonadaceae bacterium]|nr:M23 family metallopeptidase [Pyrinomonadaceae bacterium]